ncbi:uncharacterized protein DNG_09995 [Cephalotrichum gorgonifer]|uniref:BHLH domain-containing protein n=1 Tax=Cephalotrichum gorgonifer TaxID=2041049 RepID=A0AAE8N6S1_9PEZI|nr:uncharacterized protein DNG_09995 [Cephalotrichum gorgonifer]
MTDFYGFSKDNLSLDLEGAMYGLQTDFATDSAPSPASPMFPHTNAYQLPQGPDWLDWSAKAPRSPDLGTPDLSRRYSSSLSPGVNPLDLGMGLPDVVFGSHDLDGLEVPLFDSVAAAHQATEAKPRGTSAAVAIPIKKEPSVTASPTTSTRTRYSSRKRKSLASASDSVASSPSSLAPHSPGAMTAASPTDGPGPKKTAHNMIEKRYRNNLNDKIAALRDVVPSLRVTAHRLEQGLNPGEMGGNEGDGVSLDELGGLAPAQKLNKATILSKAAEYILFLERKNEQLMEENEILKRRRTGEWR